MNYELFTAKNGELSIKINSFFLHSAYNPSSEAKRYVDSISFTVLPSYIIIIEPGLNYVLPYLREKFPKTIIGCIRFFENKSSQKFDFEINYNSKTFIKQLTQHINSENLFNTQFLAWEPSKKAFPEEYEKVWNLLKQHIETEKTLLITKQYFEKKWLLNSCNFIKYAKNFMKITSKINCPILICASGPSLKDSLSIIQANRNKIFIICLSSAITVLNHHNIEPDMYFSTDGGYWANRHLRYINNSIPLAISPESFVNKSILTNQILLPLIYSDGISSFLSNFEEYHFIPAERNGTVSGTAIKFAQLVSEHSPIFFAGLDLAVNKNYQHTQPNELEIMNCINDNKINSSEKRGFISSRPNESLKIYENWFINEQFPDNIYRIISENQRNNNLNTIKDITPQEFQKRLKKYPIRNIKNYFEPFSVQSNQFNIKYRNYIETQFLNNEILKKIFSLDYVSLLRNPDNEELIIKIKNEKNDLLNKIKRIFDE